MAVAPSLNPSRLALRRRPRFQPTTFRALEQAAAPQQFAAAGTAPAPGAAPAAAAAAPAGAAPGGSPFQRLGGAREFMRSFSAGQTPLNRQVRSFVQQGLTQGAFDPGFRREQLEAGALRRGESLRRRSNILQQLLGLDPNQARVAMLGQENDIAQQIADYLGQQESAGIGDYQDRLLQLLMGQLEGETRRYEAKQARKAQQGAGLGGAFGSLAGAFIP